MRGCYLCFLTGLHASGCTVDTNGTGPGSVADGVQPTGSGGTAAVVVHRLVVVSPGRAEETSRGRAGGPGTTTGSGKPAVRFGTTENQARAMSILPAPTPGRRSFGRTRQGSSMISRIHAANPHGGTSSLEVELNWATDYYGGAFGFNFAKYNKANAYDVHAQADFEVWILPSPATRPMWSSG